MSEHAPGLPHGAIPASKLEQSRAISYLGLDVRFGSKADIGAFVKDVRFTPESGHKTGRQECPLSANSGHRDLGGFPIRTYRGLSPRSSPLAPELGPPWLAGFTFKVRRSIINVYCLAHHRRAARVLGPDGLPAVRALFKRATYGLHLCEKALDTPTARQGFPWRAFLLTVPFQAPVKSLSVERPVDAGSAEVRGRHDLARRSHRAAYGSSSVSQ